MDQSRADLGLYNGLSMVSSQESLMQDFPRLCQAEDKVGMTQFDRWIAKTSVKNNLEDWNQGSPFFVGHNLIFEGEMPQSPPQLFILALANC